MISPRKLRAGEKVSALWANQLLGFAESLRPVSTDEVRHDWTVNGVVSRSRGKGGGGSVSLRKFAFGISSINDTALTVTLNGSFVSGFADYNVIPSQTVSVGGTVNAPHYIYAEGTVSPVTGAIAQVSVSAFPTNTTTKWKMPLYKVWVENSQVQYQILHLGTVYLKSFYGP